MRDRLQVILFAVLCTSGGAQQQGPCTLSFNAHKLKCTSQGYFELVQCTADFCVCVDPRDGTAAPHTRTASPKIAPQCGACHREVAALVAKNRNWFPQCDPKNGNYKREQCLREDFCFCVDPEKGHRLGKEVKRSNEINCDPAVNQQDEQPTYKPQNNFQEEAPLASSVCKLPKDNGTRCASAPSIRYYFNTDTFECLAFLFNGCNGNANNFDTQSECWHSCKLMDFFSCSGLRKAARDPKGEIINCVGPGMAGAKEQLCPKGFKCLHGPFIGVCCNTKVEDEFARNYNPDCRRGRPVLMDTGGGMNTTLLGRTCADQFCPPQARCVQLEHFAHCCM